MIYIDDLLRIGYNNPDCMGSGTIYGISNFALFWLVMGICVSFFIFFTTGFLSGLPLKKQKRKKNV